MIILQNNLFVFKPKTFWMLHINDHLYTKLMCLFVGSEFLVLHSRLRSPRHFYCLSPLELCLTTVEGSFTRGGVYPYFLIPDTFSLPLYSTVRLCWILSHLTEPTQLNTKCNVDSSTMHLHPFNAMPPCICNAMRHCMLYHTTCIMNTTWTTQSTPLTVHHGQSHHLHMTSIHHFTHVNISCTHISISTSNMPVYVQAMTHTQSSHVMTICTYKLLTCQYIRTHILTSKHVTLSQVVTLSSKSYNGPEASHKQSQPGPRD